MAPLGDVVCTGGSVSLTAPTHVHKRPLPIMAMQPCNVGAWTFKLHLAAKDLAQWSSAGSSLVTLA